MVFCNLETLKVSKLETSVTILILIDGFLQCSFSYTSNKYLFVTILILIDGFLQSRGGLKMLKEEFCHNPSFNRWFSAIKTYKTQ